MIKTIIRAMYSAFISILIISIVLACWTGYAFIFQSSKSLEISEVIQDIYGSQKDVVVDVIDLSKILIKDKSKKMNNESKNVFLESELLVDIKEDSKSDKLQITEDNGDNPLGIIIQPSLPEPSENILPDLIEEPLVNQENEFPIGEMEMNS